MVNFEAPPTFPEPGRNVGNAVLECARLLRRGDISARNEADGCTDCGGHRR